VEVTSSNSPPPLVWTCQYIYIYIYTHLNIHIISHKLLITSIFFLNYQNKVNEKQKYKNDFKTFLIRKHIFINSEKSSFFEFFFLRIIFSFMNGIFVIRDINIVLVF
jgi:hypothetical protein